ncbi:unnamed protein product [Auanema sp. JU1783]|nr:unnamed protein product [Auanema sp. JU1783]
MMDINTSMGPAVCRVCLCGESSIPYLGKYAGEPLISPCHCKGTMGLYHRSCLEHWLSTSRTTCCEICKFKYEVGRRKQGLSAYFRVRGWRGSEGANKRFITDVLCMMSLGPTAMYITYLCVHTALTTYMSPDINDRGAFTASVVMAVFVVMIYVFWLVMTIYHHYSEFKHWQGKNEILFIVDQLDIELSQQYNTTYNRLSESRRPLIKRKLRSFLTGLCCGKRNSSSAIRIRDTALDINPHIMGALDRQMNMHVDFWNPVDMASVPPPMVYRQHNQDLLSTTNPTSSVSPLRHHNASALYRDASPVEMSSFRVACTKESGYLRRSPTTPKTTPVTMSATSSHNYDVPPDALYSEEPIETARACDISPQVGMWNVQLDSPLLNSTEVYDSPSSVERVLPRNWRRNMSPLALDFAPASLENHGFSLDGNRMQQHQQQSHQAVQQSPDVIPNIFSPALMRPNVRTGNNRQIIIADEDIEQGTSDDKSKRCIICTRTVALEDKNRYCSPCECNLIVHINCALKSAAWEEHKCETCGWPYRKTLSDIRLSRTCFICQNDKYPESKSTLHDNQFIRPCFCEMDCHHGCLANIIDTHKSCRLCGVKYRYIKYGSVKDYFNRYSCQYACCFIVFVLFAGCSIYSLLHGLRKSDQMTSSQLSLIVLGFAIGVLALTLCFACIRHTFIYKFPRFRIRYGQITILDYDPLMATYKKIRKADHSAVELSQVREEREEFVPFGSRTMHAY